MAFGGFLLLLLLIVIVALSNGASNNNNKWKKGSNLPSALGEVSAGIVQDVVYIVGQGAAATFGFNLTSSKWVSSSSLAKRPYAGGEHASAVFAAKKFFLFAGASSAASQVQVYNPSTNTWTKKASVPWNVAGLSMASVVGSHILLCGGLLDTTPNSPAIDTCGMYDPNSDSWFLSVSPLPFPICDGASGTFQDFMYIFGGKSGRAISDGISTVMRYNLMLDTWETLSVQMPEGRAGMGNAILAKGSFYLIGGESKSSSKANNKGVYKRVDVFDPTSEKWTRASNLNAARQGLSSVFYAKKNKIFTIGGGKKKGDKKSSKTVEVLSLNLVVQTTVPISSTTSSISTTSQPLTTIQSTSSTITPSTSSSFSSSPSSSSSSTSTLKYPIDLCYTTAEYATATMTCPTGYYISEILFASYGLATGTCTDFAINPSCHSSSSVSVVSSACLGKNSCSLVINNPTFGGDPCKGTLKPLKSSIRCLPIGVTISTSAASTTAAPTTAAPTTAASTSTTTSTLSPSTSSQNYVDLCPTPVSEYGKATYSCTAGYYISEVIFASYGSATGTCGNYKSSSCHASESLTVLKASCLGRTSCSVDANNQVFGIDPCPASPKSLTVQLRCTQINTGNSISANPAWHYGAPLPALIGEVSGGIIGNIMFLIGSDYSFNKYTFAYDMTLQAWYSLTTYAQRPFQGDHYACVVYNNLLVCIGGLSGSEGKIQVFDPSTTAKSGVKGTWSYRGDVPWSLYGSAVAVTLSGKIYLCGGLGGPGTMDKCGAYDYNQDTWNQNVAPLLVAVNHAAAGTNGQQMFVFGGRAGGNYPQNGFDSVQMYEPTTNKWTFLAPLPEARGGIGWAAFVNGDFYLIGGETYNDTDASSAGVYNRVDIYNVAANTWRQGPNMNLGRHGLWPLFWKNSIYVAGGGFQNGGSETSIMEILS